MNLMEKAMVECFIEVANKTSDDEDLVLNADTAKFIAGVLQRRDGGGVSAHWVLNQLSGMTFPVQGQAYDFMKKSMKAGGIEGIE